MTTSEMPGAAPEDTVDDRGETEEEADATQADLPLGQQGGRGERPESQASETTARPSSDDNGTVADPRPPLFEDDELRSMTSRWRDIQAEFVDDPTRAMHDADALVSELMQQLTRHFAEEHDRLASHWSAAETISTEDLRQGLRGYRSFFERLLAA